MGSNNWKNIPWQGGLVKSLKLRVQLIWRLLADPRISGWIKLLLVVGLLYWLLPLPVDYSIFLIDDAAILLVMSYFFVELCPTDVLSEHLSDLTTSRKKAKGTARSNPSPLSLMQTIGFTQDDLRANRQGAVSDAQRNSVLWQLGLALLILLVFGLVVFSKRREAELMGLVFGSVFFLVLLVPFVIIPLLRAALFPTVKSVKGIGYKYSRRETTTSTDDRHTSYMTYGYRVGGMDFKVNEAAYDAFVGGLVYTVYYDPHRFNKVLSIEVHQRSNKSG